MPFWNRISNRLFGAEPRKQATQWPNPAPDQSVYVVGDIHGCVDLLDQLLEKIDADAYAHGLADLRLVFVGDYIDRGETSAEVLSRIHAIAQRAAPYVICLLGNHEQMMLDFLKDPPRSGRRWLRNGGLQTIASFGVGGVVSESADDDQLNILADDLRRAICPQQLSWLEALGKSWISGNLAVVHAAMNPQKPFELQSDKALLWGHPEFFNLDRNDGLWVAHGHTVMQTPIAAAGRISIDTGAVYGGSLTAAAILPNQPVRFLQTQS